MPPPEGNGNLEHEYVQSIMRDWGLRHGWKAVIEEKRAGKRVDVGLTSSKTGSCIAVEVVISAPLSKELTNLEKDLEGGWDKVVFVVGDDKTLERLRERIVEAFGIEIVNRDRVRLIPVRRFFEGGTSPAGD